jgi:hypothetical protein
MVPVPLQRESDGGIATDNMTKLCLRQHAFNDVPRARVVGVYEPPAASGEQLGELLPGAFLLLST